MRARSERFDVLIIGGGQAGLAVGYHVSRSGLRFLIVDEHRRTGDSWRERWDSLTLFTPARLDSLPGMPFPAAPDSTVTKDAMADYLDRYAATFSLPIRLGTRVEELAVDGRAFVVRAGTSTFEADQVVIATGGHPEPARPEFADSLRSDILQLHSTEYRSPRQLRPGRVLVVGAGNSGAEIALEVSATHRTWVAGRSTGTFSTAAYSPPAWWLLKRLSDVRSPLGRRLRRKMATRGTPLVRVRETDFAAAGIERVGRITGVSAGVPVVAGGRAIETENVVWCTGFHHDFGWIKVAAGEPGLHFIGLPFQTNLASALVDGAGRDAERVMAAIGRIAHSAAGGSLRRNGGDLANGATGRVVRRHV